MAVEEISTVIPASMPEPVEPPERPPEPEPEPESVPIDENSGKMLDMYV